MNNIEIDEAKQFNILELPPIGTLIMYTALIPNIVTVVDLDILKNLLNESTYYKPIPLTEEWHNKFGIKKNSFLSFEYELPHSNNINLKVVFSTDYVFLRQSNYNEADDIVTLWNNDITKRKMYVHEWQNMYRVLTGRELKMNKEIK